MIDALLFHDVIESGGLAAALAQAARRAGVDVGDIAVVDDADWQVHVSSERGRVGVHLPAEERCFALTMSQKIGEHLFGTWTYGCSPDLETAALVIDAWRKGATLRQLHERFPFMNYDRMAQGYEDGNAVEVAWEMALEDEDFAEVWPVLRAAYTNERLRRLFPSVTMGSIVCFALDYTNRSAGDILIKPAIDNEFEVIATWDGPEPWLGSSRVVATIGEAIAAAAALIPQGDV